ncbi:exodeoxyribonuclease VII small subunit [Brevirhabdus pacifica]|uniref:Exodeoxyribonuclease 7 small subunit n=1 Tax=Brevirhabdus pacifica TaxID=1267768 RepID=A0A1U7DJ03_9RHOB|nr:exodeoxyribonuclease VII small subunit [Brevirhabdus pacifica]APX89905.1 exodeoxyribonuclease VII small subunit [Brevirhabdus pacifica]OWU74369.1 exodeoxyribonuclease VII small subunit [Loktanella sp. 22II-4b]PJJ82868.1 exodeoxyribonuclease VII small subunit [Brevirhabdus pacifica]
MTETPIEEMSFEQAMRELETVVGKLERGEVELEESIRLYERGARLKKRCDEKLKEAEEKVAAITTDAEGNATGATPVDGL